jgi:hypothetical protein
MKNWKKHLGTLFIYLLIGITIVAFIYYCVGIVRLTNNMVKI